MSIARLGALGLLASTALISGCATEAGAPDGFCSNNAYADQADLNFFANVSALLAKRPTSEPTATNR